MAAGCTLDRPLRASRGLRASSRWAEIDHHFAALGVEQQGQQLRAFVLHLDGAAGKDLKLVQGRLAIDAQAPGRVGRGHGPDAGGGQFFLNVAAFGLEGVDAQVQSGAMVEAVHQRPELGTQLVLERLHQPLGQVVAVPLHQVVGLDLIALGQPFFFLLGQRALEEVARAVKAENGQPALFRAAARGGEVVEQQFLAQHRVDGFGQCGALARPQPAVVAKKARHDGVGGVVEFEGEPDEFGTDVKQGVGVHRVRACSH
jgi:hypothetical protein